MSGFQQRAAIIKTLASQSGITKNDIEMISWESKPINTTNSSTNKTRFII